jgi:regulator of protease activity HflC (stomatin/prohibitin superfamily)
MAFEWICGGIFVLIVLAFTAVKVIYEYQRGVVFTLGKFSGVRGPGVTFILPILQEMRIVDMRITTTDVPKQEIMTKDNVPVMANTVVYFKVEKPEDAVIKIEDYNFAVSQYTQTALRDVVGNSELDVILTQREQIAEEIKKIVDAETSEWGVDISSIKIQEIELPAEMKRAMAKQAEAERDRRATVIKSEGELQASTNLMKAAANLSKSSGALQLRTLQTIAEIAADPSEMIVIFLPTELKSLIEKLK